MKKVTILMLAIGLIFICLGVCIHLVSLQESPATEPTQVSTEPTTLPESTTLPTEPTTPPTEPADTTPTEPVDTTPTEPGQREIPWDVPAIEPAPSYEDYFSQTVCYAVLTEQGYYDFDYTVGGNAPGHKLAYEAPHLYLDRHELYGYERLWEVAEIPDLQIMVYDERWIYAIEGGTDLFRMDYFGENRQLLFRDESGLIGELQDDITIADDKVICFMAGNAEGGASIYRLYLPEMKLDVMYHYDKEGLEAFYFATPYSREELSGQTEVEARYQISFGRPYSNHEVLWGAANREFYELLVKKTADPQWYEAHFGNLEVPLDMCIGSVESEYQCWHNLNYYYNAQTGTYRTQEVGVFNEVQVFYTWWEEQ